MLAICYSKSKGTGSRNVTFWWALPQSELSVPFNNSFSLLYFLTKYLIGRVFLFVLSCFFFLNIEQSYWDEDFLLTKTNCFREVGQGYGDCQQKLWAKVQDVEEIQGGLDLGRSVWSWHFCSVTLGKVTAWELNSLLNCRCRSLWNCIFCHSFSYLVLKALPVEAVHKASGVQTFKKPRSVQILRASALLELDATCSAFLDVHLGFPTQY